uniref:Splicing factor 3B subunit 4 n=1 Tax=Macrostomum lignano TaxID=282301 RepID=A0A1I8HPS0_9PLAT
MAAPIEERNQDATVYVGGLDEKVTEAIVWELFLQAGPVVNVHMPKDRITGQHQGYGFVEFQTEDDADYAMKIMNMIKLYGKPMRVNKASAHQKQMDIGANIFIGNLDPEVDEKLLFDTFSAFGVILQTPKIMRDPETGNSRGFAFINYASFDASDAAIEAMNGQYLCNRPIQISYAFKKDSKGERHGSAAERLLAAQNPLSQSDRPHQNFAEAPAMPPPPPPPPSMSMSNADAANNAWHDVRAPAAASASVDAVSAASTAAASAPSPHFGGGGEGMRGGPPPRPPMGMWPPPPPPHGYRMGMGGPPPPPPPPMGGMRFPPGGGGGRYPPPPPPPPPMRPPPPPMHQK